ALMITCARAVFTVSDREVVASRLLAHNDMSQIDESRFILVEGPNFVDGKHARAEIIITNNRMQVVTVSFDGLQKVKDIVQRVCGDAAHHRLDVYEDRMLPQDIVLHDVVRKHKGS